MMIKQAGIAMCMMLLTSGMAMAGEMAWDMVQVKVFDAAEREMDEFTLRGNEVRTLDENSVIAIRAIPALAPLTEGRELYVNCGEGYADIQYTNPEQAMSGSGQGFTCGANQYLVRVSRSR